MILFTAQKMRSFAIAAAVIAGFLVSQKPAAAAGTCSAPPCVTYTATGVFSSTVVKGTDTFKLAGQPFSISVNLVPESLKPFKSGTGYAQYKPLKFSGTVMSGLDPTPITLASSAASVELSITAKHDVFTLFTPVKVIGQTFNITAIINGPVGTITSTAIAPFTAPITLASSTTNVVYSYTPTGMPPNSTTLTIASGSLKTTVTTTNPPAGGQTAELRAPGASWEMTMPGTMAVLVRSREDALALC